MSPTPRLNSLGAAELTQKFKKETEKLVKDSSRTEPWVLLQPQKPRWVAAVLEVDTSLEVEASTLANEERGLLSPSEKSIVGKHMRDSVEHQILPSFNSESFLKLHALCSSSSSSIEMIRM